MNVRTIRDIAKGTLHDFSEHKIVQLSAALAYNALFALAPFLLVVIGVAGLVLGQDAVRSQVENHLQGMIGRDAAGTIHTMITSHRQSHSIVATVVGSLALLLGAAGLVGQLKAALNTIWGVKQKPGSGLKGMLRERFLSIAMVFGICFLLLVSMILSTALAASSQALGRALSLPPWIGYIVDLLFSMVFLTVLFGAMFKFLPDVKLPWRNVWVGAIATAVLFSIGKWGLALYLGRESTASAYGAAGSVVILVMWVYYASVIVFLGAELTQVITRQYAHVQVQPTENAMIDESAPGHVPQKAEPVVEDKPVRKQLSVVTALFAIVALVRWMRS